MIKEPIFLVGAERSGTTMLRLMLSHHPNISWLNEFEYSIDMLADSGQTPALHDYYQWLSMHRVFGATGFKIDNTLDYHNLADSFLQQRLDADNKQIVGATVHRHFDRLLHIWPDARFIHICRDPRDVARSNVVIGWCGNVWTGAERWIEAENIWKNLSGTLPENRRAEVCYEQLVANPETELTKLCEFIGETYSPAMMRYNEDTTYSTPDPSLTQQWRRKLPDRDIQIVESRVAELLESRGYEHSNLPPIKVSAFSRLKLKCHHRIARALYRIKRYGPALVLQAYFANRLGFTDWRAKVRGRINTIDATYIK